mgnify:CR=1 FL=1|jgi:predicted SnoaL-like aldol condensation-catalyzing enzyme
MATKTFGKEPETERNYVAELHKLVGAKFPVSVTTEFGKLVNVVYETEWKEGNTTPVETDELDENDNPIIDYKENYTKRKLTAAQIKKVDAYIKKNIAE